MVTLMPGGPRGYVGVTAVASMVLFAGGTNTGWVDTDLVEVLDAGSLQWLPAINPPMALSVARHGPRAVTIGAKAMFAGVGGGGGLPSDVVDIFDPSSGRPYCTAKTNSQGCVPAIGSSGIASASSGSGFFVNGTNFINNKSCLLFYGVSGQATTPFQGGTLCVKSPIKRTPGTNTGGTAHELVRGRRPWRDAAAGTAALRDDRRLPMVGTRPGLRRAEQHAVERRYGVHGVAVIWAVLSTPR
jgi:hypothetical protein